MGMHEIKVSTKDLLECVAINNVMKDWLNTSGVDVGLLKHVLSWQYLNRQ